MLKTRMCMLRMWMHMRTGIRVAIGWHDQAAEAIATEFVFASIFAIHYMKRSSCSV